MTQARTTDPETSWANVSTEKADRATVLAFGLFQCGRSMTDEDLYDEAVAMGEQVNEGRLRHGRLALARLGMIVATGEKRRLRGGGLGRVWLIAPEYQR